ncbi:hypothetical protein FQN51_003335 [Onygenales sp. PD_10]|nr:hypothetical protein FQN51_003335 [Onygenales sp. PD_10]
MGKDLGTPKYAELFIKENATMSSLTLAPPPEGVVPDFDGMSSVQRRFIVVYAATLLVATIALVCRIYTRLAINKQFGIDDYAATGSIFFSGAFFGLCVVCMDHGFGKHIWEVTVAQSLMYTKLLIAIVIVYCWCPMLNKISILLLFHRLTTTFIVTTGCIPTDPKNTDCINTLALWQAILNIASDALMLLLPLPLLWALHMPILQKIALGLIFTLGSLVIITSIIRITYIRDLQDKPDFTWYQATACVWSILVTNLPNSPQSAIELNVGIICNCLVVLKPFVKKFIPRLFPSSAKHGTSSIPGTGGLRPSLLYGYNNKENSHSYQLGSMDRNQGPTKDSDSDEQGIVITKSYVVEGKGRGGRNGVKKMSDSESTENIITPYSQGK